MKKSRSKAFFINGGAGRVLSSIPALEKYHEESGDKDFVIVCEAGMDFYRGHPTLHKHAYEVWHKGLFETIRDKDSVSPEPYRVNEYYNQKCSLAQAFDIEINSLEDPRDLPVPTIQLNKFESVTGYQTIQEMKAGCNKDKAVVIQPFGRTITKMGEHLIDGTSRSFELGNIVNIIGILRELYTVIVMSEIPFDVPENAKHPIAFPKEPNLRLWASMINSADHFLGCDSVGQHIAKALDKTATVVVGSTVPINITYLDDDSFDVIDFGAEKGRNYSPIRLTMDDEIDRGNDKVMMLETLDEKRVVDSCVEFLGEAKPFSGNFTPTQQAQGCGVAPTPQEQKPKDLPKYDFASTNLLDKE
jgi:hypothetical protein